MTVSQSQSADFGKIAPPTGVEKGADGGKTAEALKAKVTTTTEAKSGLLQTAIGAEAGKKIQELTGLNPKNLLGDFDEIGKAITEVMSIFKSKDEDPEKVVDLFGPLGVDADTMQYVMTDPENFKEADAPQGALDEEEFPQEEDEDLQMSVDVERSLPQAPKWQPSKQNLDRKTSRNQRYIAEKASKSIKEKNYMPFFEKAAKDYGLSTSVLVAFAMKESSMNPLRVNAESKATGLAQVIPSTLREYRAKVDPKADPKDPETGIRIIAYLAHNAIKSVHNMVIAGTATFRVKKRDPRFPDRKDKFIRTTFTCKTKPEYEIKADDVMSLYVTHNSGVAGYIAYKNYESALATGDAAQIAEAKKGLQYWQEDIKNGKEGWIRRANYARETAEVAYHWNDLNQQSN